MLPRSSTDSGLNQTSVDTVLTIDLAAALLSLYVCTWSPAGGCSLRGQSLRDFARSILHSIQIPLDECMQGQLGVG